jgi:hypothetical protein
MEGRITARQYRINGNRETQLILNEIATQKNLVIRDDSEIIQIPPAKKHQLSLAPGALRPALTGRALFFALLICE